MKKDSIYLTEIKKVWLEPPGNQFINLLSIWNQKKYKFYLFDRYASINTHLGVE
jgi:hypothetical protein